MATNTYKKTKKKKKKKARFSLNFLKDRRFHLVFGFFLIVTSLYFFIAFVSYLFTGQTDQSLIEPVLSGDMKDTGLEAENWLGLLGALIAHYFIFKWFGIASFLIPPLFFVIGYKIVFRKELLPLYHFFVFVTFVLIWSSLLFGYLVITAEGTEAFSFLGGGIGYELAVLAHSIMGWGTILLLAFTLLAFVVYFFNVTHLFESRQKDTLQKTPAKQTVDNEPEPVVSENHESNPEPVDIDAGNETEEAQPEEVSGGSIALDISTSEDYKPSQKKEKPEELALEVEEQPEQEKTADHIENYDPTLDLPKYRHPEPGLLDETNANKVQVTKEELESNKDKILETLINFKIGISSIKATIGPTVTLYEIVPDPGVKISKIKNLEDDIALNLAALGIRIIAPIPGKGTIGIEVPNKNREIVSMHSVMTTEKFMKSNKELPVILGKTVSNELYITDLAQMPHLLMAGATGQGKSVGLNVLLTSLVYKKHPSQLKFVLVDPKMVELSLFRKLERHFLAKLPDAEEAIITDTKKVVNTLNSLCIEMDNRYDLLKDGACRNLKEYNTKFVRRKLNPEKGHRFLPYIVLVIDELADLMMTAGKEVEMPIARLAQKARAIGIHLVVATQRPSVNVITGIIKANFPARWSFRVTSKVDSRTILDTGGAEQLVGMGDTLLSMGSDLIRVQCPFIDTPEVDNICEFIGSQRGYESAYILPEYVDDESGQGAGEVDTKNLDPMYEEAARVIVINQQGSTSLLQRKLKIGYNRAGRLIDQLEATGIVGPFEGSKAREVLVSDEQSLEQLLKDTLM